MHHSQAEVSLGHGQCAFFCEKQSLHGKTEVYGPRLGNFECVHQDSVLGLVRVLKSVYGSQLGQPHCHLGFAHAIVYGRPTFKSSNKNISEQNCNYHEISQIKVIINFI